MSSRESSKRITALSKVLADQSSRRSTSSRRSSRRFSEILMNPPTSSFKIERVENDMDQTGDAIEMLEKQNETCSKALKKVQKDDAVPYELMKVQLKLNQEEFARYKAKHMKVAETLESQVQSLSSQIADLNTQLAGNTKGEQTDIANSMKNQIMELAKSLQSVNGLMVTQTIEHAKELDEKDNKLNVQATLLKEARLELQKITAQWEKLQTEFLSCDVIKADKEKLENDLNECAIKAAMAADANDAELNNRLKDADAQVNNYKSQLEAVTSGTENLQSGLQDIQTGLLEQIQALQSALNEKDAAISNLSSLAMKANLDKIYTASVRSALGVVNGHRSAILNAHRQISNYATQIAMLQMPNMFNALYANGETVEGGKPSHRHHKKRGHSKSRSGSQSPSHSRSHRMKTRSSHKKH